MTQVISIRKLLSVCVYANLEACQIIRQYYHHNRQVKDNNDDIRYKEAGDPRSVVTKADIDAQCRIMDILRRQTPWGPHLNIVGEEDESSDEATEISSNNKNYDNEETSIARIFQHLFQDNKSHQDDDIPIDEVCVFIDPLDGTREFVENRIQNVGCLIGITRNGKAVAGTVGVPFPLSSSNHPPYFVRYAFLKKATGDTIAGSWPISYLQETSSPNKHEDFTNIDDASDDSSTIIYTGDSKNNVLSTVVHHAKQIIRMQQQAESKDDKDIFQHAIVGGTATKLSRVATSPCSSIAILHFGTSVWDTVATEALVRSTGGHVTDFLGRPLATHSCPSKIKNMHGVIASSKKARSLHDELCKQILNDKHLLDLINRS